MGVSLVIRKYPNFGLTGSQRECIRFSRKLRRLLLLMKKPRKPPVPRRYEAHIYMDEADYAALKRAADRELRSLAAQALHYIRRGLEAER